MAGRRGLFIVLEGVEGCGKSTQAKLLGEWLGRRGIDHVLTREPGGTPTGEAIRRILLEHDEVPPRAELLLMLAARAALVEEVVRPALEAGRVVVADRYELSSLAYQGYGRGLGLDAVRDLNRFATGGLSPDVTFVFEVSAAESERRREAAGRTADRIERAGADFHGRVAEAYRLLAEQEPGIERVDGHGRAEEIHGEVTRRLERTFPETFAHTKG